MAVYKYTCPFIKRDGTPCNKRCIQPLCCVHLKSVNASKYVDFVSDDEEESAPEVAPVPKKPIAKKRVQPPVDDISDKMQAVAIRPKKQPPVPKPKQPVQYVSEGGEIKKPRGRPPKVRESTVAVATKVSRVAVPKPSSKLASAPVLNYEDVAGSNDVDEDEYDDEDDDESEIDDNY